MSDIEHEMTDEVVCPHCGHVHEDSWERKLSDGEQESEQCDKCGMKFIIVASVTIHYTTAPLP